MTDKPRGFVVLVVNDAGRAHLAWQGRIFATSDDAQTAVDTERRMFPRAGKHMQIVEIGGQA